MITFEFYTPAEVSALKGDDKLELVIELRARMSTCHPRTVASATGLNEQTVVNFINEDVTLPRATTISAFLGHIAPKKSSTFALSPERLKRIRERTRNRGRRAPTFRTIRRSARRVA